MNLLDVTPDGKKLLAVNTADNRLQIDEISVASFAPVILGSVPLGLDPESVIAHDDKILWIIQAMHAFCG